jgi:hypothetical protein
MLKQTWFLSNRKELQTYVITKCNYILSMQKMFSLKMAQ